MPLKQIGIVLLIPIVLIVWTALLLLFLELSLLTASNCDWLLWSMVVVTFSTLSVLGTLIIDRLYILLLGV